MAALWPSLMWPPVLEAFYHAKTGVQKDFTMKLCLGEIMGGKAHKMIIQYDHLMCLTPLNFTKGPSIKYVRSQEGGGVKQKSMKKYGGGGGSGQKVRTLL